MHSVTVVVENIGH